MSLLDVLSQISCLVAATMANRIAETAAQKYGFKIVASARDNHVQEAQSK